MLEVEVAPGVVTNSEVENKRITGLDVHSEVSACMRGMLDVVVSRQVDRNVVVGGMVGCQPYARTDESECGSEPTKADDYRSATGWCGEASEDGQGTRNGNKDNSLGNYPGVLYKKKMKPGVANGVVMGKEVMLEVEDVSVAGNPAPGVVTKPAHFNAILGVHLDPRIAAGNRENMPPVSLNISRFQRHRWPLNNNNNNTGIKYLD
jgi:hypothetical protein